VGILLALAALLFEVQSEWSLGDGRSFSLLQQNSTVALLPFFLLVLARRALLRC